MIARIAIYSHSGDARELGKKAEEGLLPILEAQPGFQGYSVAVGDGKVFSSSAWTAEPKRRAAAPPLPRGSQRT
ncbi:MAG: hypothetical protein ACKVUT_16275 [Gaiella sp.]